ncbi:retrotransposon protein, putative, ty1-copia subclass [Tanacetum coccineum]
MMNLTTLPKLFWGYALESASHILNMVPTKKVERTSYKIWHGKAPKLSYLRVWGYEALVKRDTSEKLDPRSIKCIFIGYLKETMGYYFYYPIENKIFVARNAEFFENSLLVQESGVESCDFSKMCGSNKGFVRIPQAPDRYGFYDDVEEHELRDLNEPPNYKDALSDLEYDKWLKAMNTEMQSMKDNLSKGYTQSYGVDMWIPSPPFFPVDRHLSYKDSFAIAAFYDYENWQMDTKTAFLNGHLSEDVYMV